MTESTRAIGEPRRSFGPADVQDKARIVRLVETTQGNLVGLMPGDDVIAHALLDLVSSPDDEPSQATSFDRLCLAARLQRVRVVLMFDVCPVGP